MTLLLGPAGSGRSTLLKALCGQLTDSKMVTTQGLGDIRYNGQTHDSFVVQRTATYVDQVGVGGTRGCTSDAREGGGVMWWCKCVVQC
jgi:ABC-type cobalamin/Fe3+-siderophores transport system ATPase subunit